MEFKKASIKEIVKHKIKWIVKILNYPFKKLEELMWFYEKIHIFQV